MSSKQDLYRVRFPLLTLHEDFLLPTKKLGLHLYRIPTHVDYVVEHLNSHSLVKNLSKRVEGSTRSRSYEIMDCTIGDILANNHCTSHFAAEFLASF